MELDELLPKMNWTQRDMHRLFKVGWNLSHPVPPRYLFGYVKQAIWALPEAPLQQLRRVRSLERFELLGYAAQLAAHVRKPGLVDARPGPWQKSPRKIGFHREKSSNMSCSTIDFPWNLDCSCSISPANSGTQWNSLKKDDESQGQFDDEQCARGVKNPAKSMGYTWLYYTLQ